MYNLEIFYLDESTGDLCIKPHWKNFKNYARSIHNEKKHPMICDFIGDFNEILRKLLNEYNCNYPIIEYHPRQKGILQFQNQDDLTEFVLRWS